MAEIVEVFEDIKKGIGNKGFYLLLGAAALFGIYNLSKGSGGSDDMASTRLVTSVSSYPDAVTNANVIIDSIQNSIDYSEAQITDKIQGTQEEMKDYLEKNFEATNDYINKGFESQKDLMEKNFDEIQGGISNIQSNNSDVSGALSDMQDSYNQTGKDLADLIKNSSVTKAAEKVASIEKKSTTKKTTKKSSNTKYYKYKTKSGLNTSTSIVDALKATGVNSSMSNRKKIAEANGIKNYTGTYKQNVTLLSKLKTGKLKKA